MVKLSEVLQEHKRKSHRLEIWKTLAGHLCQYAEEDTDKELVTDSGVVPRDVAASVLEEIRVDVIAPLEKELETMEGMEVASGNSKGVQEAKKGNEAEAGKKAVQGKAEADKPRKLRRPV